ncbi:MAG: glycosyltransferase family 4 protein [Alphaproteobacteria bacterium]
MQLISTDIQPPDEKLDTEFAVTPWTHVSGDILRRDFDILVAAIGDNYLYHGGIFELFGHIPTLGIFHDFYLYDLFNGWLWKNGERPEEIRGQLHDYEVSETYGPELVDLGRAARSGLLGLSDIADNLPMTEWVARYCDGALAHSSFYLDRLRSACPGPVSEAAMPLAGRGIKALKARSKPKVRVLTVGVMNPNKCVDLVIEAIGNSAALKDVVEYHLAGPIEPAEAQRLNALAAELGFMGLTIHGAVDNDVLDHQLEASDIICCLRRPVLEGASGSAIEGLLAGRPLIVANAGFYADLPNDLVFKVSRDISLVELTDQLVRLTQDPALRKKSGAAARRWAEETFRLDAYALKLETLMGETVQAKAVIRVAQKFGQELLSLGINRNDPALVSISATLSELFSPEDA